MIHLYYKEEKRPICFFNTDEAALYRLFLKLLNENRNLDFTRVYADIVEIFGVGLKDFVEGRSQMCIRDRYSGGHEGRYHDLMVQYSGPGAERGLFGGADGGK